MSIKVSELVESLLWKIEDCMKDVDHESEMLGFHERRLEEDKRRERQIANHE
ncbi:hypothetical protein HanRHA438_Chr04g0152731 [Helianthus annuus]|nr:hypothetical protein HanRHA438_Chr04g0152731 [Helianthus annuus]